MIKLRSENCRAYIQKNILFLDEKGYTCDKVQTLIEKRQGEENFLIETEENLQDKVNILENPLSQEANSFPIKTNENKQLATFADNSSKGNIIMNESLLNILLDKEEKCKDLVIIGLILFHII